MKSRGILRGSGAKRECRRRGNNVVIDVLLVFLKIFL